MSQAPAWLLRLNIGFLQAIYSFPNIFTVLIGGFIIDRIGTRKR